MKNRLIKNYLLYPRFQVRLIFYFLLVTGTNIFLFFLANQYFFNVFRQKGKELGIPANHIFYSFISKLETEMDLIFVGVSAFGVMIVILLGLLLSHRVAGPLYRFSTDLKGMAKSGKLAKVRFREKDYMMDIEEDFNAVVDINLSR